MSAWRHVVVLVISGLIPFSVGAVIPITNPAKVEDVQKIVRMIGFDQATQTEFRRGLETNNKTNPELYLDPEICMRPFTIDAINLRESTVIANFLSHDYAQKLLKELPKPTGKNSTRLMQIQMNQGLDAAYLEFKKMALTDQNAINEFRNSPTFLSWKNALTNSLAARNEMVSNWSRDEMRGRISQARKVLAELMEAGIKLDQEERGEDVKLSERIPLTGMRSTDQGARLTFEYLRAYIKQNMQFYEGLKALDLGKVLLPANLVSRQGLESGNLAILSAENMFDDNSRSFESLSNTYTDAIEKIPMSQQQREELIATEKKAMEVNLDYRLRRDEHLRAVLELKKQVLALCENSFGKIKFEGGKLIFDSEQELNQYNSLIQQVNVENQALLDVENREMERRSRLLEAFKKK